MSPDSEDRFPVVILAGGQGTRFWPLSRAKKPKQFLPFGDSGESLLQATARRLLPVTGKNDLWIATNNAHAALCKEHVPYAHLVGEPIGRNTAACIGLSALYLKRKYGDAVVVHLHSDAAVSDETNFLQSLLSGVRLAAAEDLLVTIGITPTTPHTGYGYIRKGKPLGQGHDVKEFVEKPDLARAEAYCRSGEYLWNCGMFAWRIDVLLEAFKTHMPDTYAGLREIDKVIGSAKEEEVIAQVYSRLEPVSIDIGIMERAPNRGVVEAKPFGWNDVGSWDAWAEYFHHDNEQNVLIGDVFLKESKNNLIVSEERFTAVIGAQNLIVIDAGDSLLICAKEKAQDVKSVVEALKKKRKRKASVNKKIRWPEK